MATDFIKTCFSKLKEFKPSFTIFSGNYDEFQKITLESKNLSIIYTKVFDYLHISGDYGIASYQASKTFDEWADCDLTSFSNLCIASDIGKFNLEWDPVRLKEIIHEQISSHWKDFCNLNGDSALKSESTWIIWTYLYGLKFWENPDLIPKEKLISRNCHYQLAGLKLCKNIFKENGEF